MVRIVGAICLLVSACGISNAQAASGMPPLVEIKSLDGNTYIFDVSKISAVTIQPHYIGGDPGPPMQLPHPGPMATHIWGAVKLPIPIDGSTQDFLTMYKLDKKFITVHGTPNEVHLKAAAISLIEPHILTYQEQETCKGKPDNSSCSFTWASGAVTNGTCHKIPIF
jgi:hypothetical protein